MIAIEPAAEGFVLLVDGARLLSHSRRSPCVEIGVAENLVRKGGSRMRSRGRMRVPLRSFKVVESSPELIVVDFDGKLALAARQDGPVTRITFSRFDSSINYFRLRLAAWPDEGIFGCGARSSALDLKGRRVRLWVQDRCIGTGLSPLRILAALASELGSGRESTAFPAPAFVSTKGYWCAADSSAYAVLDFRRSATVLSSWAVPREVAVGREAGAPAMVAGLCSYAGRPSAPPDWTFDGAMLELRGGIAELDRRLEAAEGAGVKVAAFWCRDWNGPAGPGVPIAAALAADDSLYPGLPSAINALRSRGIRFLGAASPLLAPRGGLYAEASARGFCVKDAEGADYLATVRGAQAALLDLTNPEAYGWIVGLMRREMLGIGMAGWLADSAEFLPADAVLASGEGGAAAHNRWPLLWARACREAAGPRSEGGALILARSGWLGSARYVDSFWTGERIASFLEEDGLPGTVPAALSLCLSGGGFPHSEAGGTLSLAWARRSGECLRRWVDAAAFSPLLRLGDGRRPEMNEQFWSDPASLELLGRMSGVFAALKPYHLAAAADQAESGLPPCRPAWLHYESDPEAGRLSRQYLYGRDLMVAPALEPRARARSGPLTELYLPDDEWVHLWTSRGFRGGRIAVESPVGCPAVFYRAASPFAPLFDALRRSVRRT